MSLGAAVVMWLTLDALPGAPAAAAAPAPASAMGATSAMGAMNATPGADDADDVQDVEDVEDVTEVKDVTPASASPARKKPTFWQTLGRLHPALVHFPIAWLVLLLLVDIRTVAWGRPGGERLGLYVLVGTVLSFIPAIVTGLLRANELPRSPETMALIVAHRNLALATAGVLSGALILRLARKNRLEGGWRWAYLGLLATATAGVLLTGHRGARMVFGTEFLPF